MIDGTGNGLANTITGNGNDNVLSGLDGNDTLTGGAGHDTLLGGAGIDKLDGGIGDDILTGGLGADVFTFNANSGHDTITDFSASQNDSINIHAWTAGVVDGGGVSITEANGDTTIDLGGGNVVTVTGASMADVRAHLVW